MTKEYICECGKVFNNPQSFNGHKSHCRIHLGEEKYQHRLFQAQQFSKLGNDIFIKNCNITKQLKLGKWVSEHHTCEHCGKIMTEYYGSGRFCCVQCANSRQHSEETKEKIRISTLQQCCNDVKPKRNYRFKSGYYKGIYCASSYELVYLVYCLDNNINIIRADDIKIPYEWQGKKHIYIPDFYIKNINSIVELKGFTEFYNKDLTTIKLESARNNNFNVIYIDSNNIHFYFDYVKSKYKISKVWQLYDK